MLKKAGPALRFSEHMSGPEGEAMFRHACVMGLEGIVSKKLMSRYKSGACKSWVKVKEPTVLMSGDGGRARSRPDEQSRVAKLSGVLGVVCGL